MYSIQFVNEFKTVIDTIKDHDSLKKNKKP